MTVLNAYEVSHRNVLERKSMNSVACGAGERGIPICYLESEFVQSIQKCPPEHACKSFVFILNCLCKINPDGNVVLFVFQQRWQTSCAKSEGARTMAGFKNIEFSCSELILVGFLFYFSKTSVLKFIQVNTCMKVTSIQTIFQKSSNAKFFFVSHILSIFWRKFIFFLIIEISSQKSKKHIKFTKLDPL